MRHACRLFFMGLAVASSGMAQSMPAEVAALAAKAKLDRPVAAWCRGEFRSGHRGAFAVAVTAPAGGGRYLVLDTDGTVFELAAFTKGADLSCYTRAEAARLSVSISRSQTIQGEVSPRWNTTVVCAFVDNTTSVCWQHSPVDGVFVKVGGWVT